ncbi:hypothetical protein AVEN_2539-1 [Araneus ventricosus]|uniref:Uncharacterized protein n=1 Tax=Araneus ventricosus TaxID=182803 RepID=A0A4Y2QHV4_ARAVE|nr:hypothetical protein AVEN_2539-1 [Araneus ventricosus]
MSRSTSEQAFSFPWVTGSATGVAGGVSQQELAGQKDCSPHDCLRRLLTSDGLQNRLTALLVKEGGPFEPLYQ